MSGPWLYPISKNADTYFELANGRRIDVSIESFKSLVSSGKINEDAWWFIKQNWRNIHPGDEVYIYTGDDDQGIVGYARIADIQEFLDATPSGWYLYLDFDLKKCRALLGRPISARIVRDKWVHYPRKTVINLQGYESEIESYLPWKVGVKKSIS